MNGTREYEMGVGEEVQISGPNGLQGSVKINEIKGNSVRIGFCLLREIPIFREEIVRKILMDNPETCGNRFYDSDSRYCGGKRK